MDESVLKNDIVRRFRISGALATRIESPDVSVGMPDIYMCYNGHSLFIEVKIGDNPLFKPSQYHWMLNHAKAGGNSYVMWFVDHKCCIIPTSNIELLRTRSKKDWQKATEFKCELIEFNPPRARFYSEQIAAYHKYDETHSGAQAKIQLGGRKEAADQHQNDCENEVRN